MHTPPTTPAFKVSGHASKRGGRRLKPVQSVAGAAVEVEAEVPALAEVLLRSVAAAECLLPERKYLQHLWLNALVQIDGNRLLLALSAVLQREPQFSLKVPGYQDLLFLALDF